MIIKVCGMREAQNIREVEALGIDRMGFIFYPTQAKRVGVFVDASLDDITHRVDEYGLDLVQLHGDELPQQCRELRAAMPAVKLIKALSIKDEASVQNAAKYDGAVDYLLFDTHCDGKGGSGRTFDHGLLSAYRGSTPFLLSGGLSVDNADEIMAFSHPMLAGYDLNSRFEIAPALKEPARIKQFMEFRATRFPRVEKDESQAIKTI